MDFWDWLILGAVMDQAERNRQLAEENRRLQARVHRFGGQQDEDGYGVHIMDEDPYPGRRPNPTDGCGQSCTGCGCLIGIILFITTCISLFK